MNAFTDAIMAALGYAPQDPEPNVITRFATSPRSSKRDGWCILFADRRGGTFGCHRTGIQDTWQAERQRSMTKTDRLAQAVAIAEATKLRHREQSALRAEKLKKWSPVWEKAQPLADCAATRYLERRGFSALTGRWPPSLRCTRLDYWHEGNLLGTFPVRLGAMQGADGRMVALHRTFLNEDGSKANVPNVKKLTGAFGMVMGASVRLFAAQRRLGVSEGLETAIAACLGSGVPTWAAVSASGLERFQWPEQVRELFIFGDCDESRRGQVASECLAQRASRAGLAVRVLKPGEVGRDWADVYAEAVPL